MHVASSMMTVCDDTPQSFPECWGCCIVTYPQKNHLKFKYHENAFIHNITFSFPIVSNFYKEHKSDTVVLCAKFKNDSVTAKEFMDKRYYMIFGIATTPCALSTALRKRTSSITTTASAEWHIESEYRLGTTPCPYISKENLGRLSISS